MSLRANTVAVRAVWIAGALCSIVAIVIQVGDRGHRVNSGDDVLIFTVLIAISTMTMLTIGVLIVRHQPRNVIGSLFLAEGFLLAVAYATSVWAESTLIIDPGSLPAGAEAA